MAPEDTMNRSALYSLSQQAVDMYFFLFDRPLHPELFRHYADYRVRQGNYHADVWVVGLSHVVMVTCGQRSVTELVCHDGDLLPTRGLLSRFRLKGERDQERQLADGWSHLVSTQVETMDKPLYKSVHNDLLRHTSKRGWLVPYEQWGDGELSPFTYIDYEARDTEFHIHAFHAFPQDRTLIKSQSIVELPS